MCMLFSQLRLLTRLLEPCVIPFRFILFCTQVVVDFAGRHDLHARFPKCDEGEYTSRLELAMDVLLALKLFGPCV